MEATERRGPGVLATGEQHPCRAAGFADFEAGSVEQSLPARFASTVAAHRDCLAVADASSRSTGSSNAGYLPAWNAARNSTTGCGTGVSSVVPSGSDMQSV